MGNPARNQEEFQAPALVRQIASSERWAFERPFTALLFLGLVAGTHAFEGGHLGQLLQGTALMIVAGTTLIISTRNLGLRTTWVALSASLLGRPVDPQDSSIRDFNDHVAGWAMMGGHIGAVLGLIHVMSYLNEPANIGMGVAVAFMSYVYGGVAAVVLPFGVRRRGAPGLRAVDAVLPMGVLGCIFALIMFAIRA